MAKPNVKLRKPTLVDQSKATINLSVYNGTRRLFPKKDILLRVQNAQQGPQISKYVLGPNVSVHVPFFDNFADNYSVLVSCDGHRDAGFFPVKVSPTLDSQLELMLVPKRAQYGFLRWPQFAVQYPRYATFLACGSGEDSAEQHYEDLASQKPSTLALLLNLTAAMSIIQLPTKTPLDYFREIEWDDSLAQDRFFGFADERIVQEVKTATKQGTFAPEPAPGLFHGDATSSFRQIQFGEANVQLTFHENTVKTINRTRCIRIEPDIDYYKDLGAHTLLEVIPNSLSHGLTDPQVVYVLRWIAGRHAGIPEFDPAYTLV